MIVCCTAVSYEAALPAFCPSGMTPAKLLLVLDAEEPTANFFRDMQGTAGAVAVT